MRIQHSPIRFGVISHSESVPAWQVESLQQALGVEGVELAVVACTADNDSSTDAVGLGGGALWQAAQQRLQGSLALLKPASLQDVSAGADWLTCKLANRTIGEYEMLAEDVEQIGAYNLDFVISLCPQQPSGALLGVARCGVWYFQFGGSQSGQETAGFWEIYHREALSSARLLCSQVAAKGGPATAILRQARLRTIDGSYAANLEQLLRESVRGLAQACLDLADGHNEFLVPRTRGEVKNSSLAPTNAQYLLFSLRIRLNKIGNFLSHFLLHRHWGVVLSFTPAQNLWQDIDSVQAELLPAPPRETFHADPFGMEYEDGLALLYEQWNSSLGVGKIAGSLLSAEYLEQLAGQTSGIAARETITPSPFETNFDFPYHCSYPYIFTHEGATYCIPETGEGRTIALYRCAGHPGEWIHVTDLVTDFAALDSSVIFYAGKWWLFCANLDDNPNSHLYLWYADELTGEWQAHGNNPVKMDICGGRPAGTPFEIDGELYRPSQDNSRNYGSGLTIQKISRLTPSSFAEEPCGDLKQLCKRLNVDGMHTLSRVGNYTLLDYYRETFLPAIFVYRLKLYLRSKFQR